MDRLIRILIILLLLTAAVVLTFAGTEALPAWIRGLAAQVGMSSEVAAKIFIGITIAIAGTITALGTRGRILALFSAGVVLFSGVADIAAWFSMETPGNIFWPIAQLLGGGIPFILNAWSKPASSPPFRHPFGAGILIAISLLLGAIVAANVTPKDTAIRNTERVQFVTHDFEPDDWPGIPLQETGLIEHVPALGALTQYGGPTVIAFYTPHCNVCHDFFDEHVPGVPDGQVIAIKVPPATGVAPVDSDLPEEVDCSKCTRLTLPRGPIWLIQSPLVLAVVDGKVTCVAQHFQEEEMAECIKTTMALAKARQEASITRETQPEESLPSSGG